MVILLLWDPDSLAAPLTRRADFLKGGSGCPAPARSAVRALCRAGLECSRRRRDPGTPNGYFKVGCVSASLFGVRPQDPGHSGDREAHLFGNLAVFKPCAPNSFTFPRTVITF